MNNLAQVTPAKPLPSGHVTVHGAMRKAIANGGVPTSLVAVNWDIAGTGKLRCTRPVNRSLQADQSIESKLFTKQRRPRQWLDMAVRCRRCDNCLRLRGHDWSQRAVVEINQSYRTWFGTLTLAPAMHERSRLVARSLAARAMVNFDNLPNDEQFHRRHLVISRWINLFVKKVRKASKGPLRLMLVCELHKSGLPHYHMLVHEETQNGVSERLLRGKWAFGHSLWRLVDERVGAAAWYMAKYLTKSSVARVRASLDYGRRIGIGTTDAIIAKAVKTLYSKALPERETKTQEHKPAQGLLGVLANEQS